MRSSSVLTVLHAIPTLGGGGAERQLAMLAREQQVLGARVHIVCVAGGANEALLDDSGVSVHVLPKLGNHDPVLVLRLARLMHRLHPAVVQTWLPQMDVLAGIAAHGMAIPHVLSERASALAYVGGWKIAVRRYLGVRADAVVANSDAGLRYWREAGMRGQPFVVRNGLFAERIARARPIRPEQAGLPADCRIVLFAGRFVDQKNLPLLVDAIDRVLDVDASAVLVLFGDGPLRPWLVARISRMRNSGRVFLYGYSEALVDWMKAASLFVSVSRYEGAPNVVMEAMLAGCPLVVSDIPEHRELLSEDRAILCSESADAVSGGILEVLHDPASAASRATRATEVAAAWSVQRAARSYLDIYERLREG